MSSWASVYQGPRKTPRLSAGDISGLAALDVYIWAWYHMYMKSTTSDPTNRRWTVYLPADLLERLRQSAIEHRRSLNSELVWALDQYAQAEKRKRKRDADQESV